MTTEEVRIAAQADKAGLAEWARPDLLRADWDRYAANYPMTTNFVRDGHPDARGGKHLLYQVYVEEQGWKPPAANPSRYAIVRMSDGRHALTDAYENCQLWAVVRDGDQPIACTRLMTPTPATGQLEIERYQSSDAPLHELVADLRDANEQRLFELNRMAVAPAYRRRSCWLSALLKCFSYAQACRASVIGASSIPLVRELMLAIGTVEQPDVSFRYDDSDPRAAHVFTTPFGDGTVEVVCKRLAAMLDGRNNPSA